MDFPNLAYIYAKLPKRGQIVKKVCFTVSRVFAFWSSSSSSCFCLVTLFENSKKSHFVTLPLGYNMNFRAKNIQYVEVSSAIEAIFWIEK